MSESELPRRSRGTRALIWLALIVVALIVLLVLIHTIWSARAGSRLTAMIEALKAKGEPVTIEAIAPKPIPEEQNAYVDVRRAIALLPAENDAGKQLDEIRTELRVPLFDDEKTLIKTTLENTNESLVALKPAVNKPMAVNDQMIFKPPLISILLPDLGPLRNLAVVVRHSAMIDFEAGRHDLAVEKLRFFEPIAKSAAANKSLVGTLVAIGIRSMQAATVTEMAPELKVGTAAGDAPPQLIRQLTADLLDDRAIKEDMTLGFLAERLFQIDIYDQMDKGDFTALSGAPGQPSSTSGLQAFVAKPIIRQNAEYCLEHTTKLVDLTRGNDFENWPRTKKVTTQWEGDIQTQTASWQYMLARALLPSFSRAIDTHFRVKTDRALAATALAIRLYQSEHNGGLPESLDVLVPAYLTTVPLDPRADGKPLNFRGGDDPIIWSAGNNAEDDNGSEAPESAAASRLSRELNQWEKKDAVVHLKQRQRENSAIDKE